MINEQYNNKNESANCELNEIKYKTKNNKKAQRIKVNETVNSNAFNQLL